MPDRDFEALLKTMNPDGVLEVEPVELYGFDAEVKLRRAAAAILRLDAEWVGLSRLRGGKVRLLRRDGSRERLPVRDLWRRLTARAAEQDGPAINSLLDHCQVAPARRQRAFDAVLRERIRGKRLGTLYILRTPAGAPFVRQLREAGVTARLAGMLGAHACEYLLWLCAWYVLGSDAFAARVDTSRLWTWSLLLFALVPFRMLNTWWRGKVAIGAGGLLRKRLLAGALKLHPDEVRHEGAGHFLGRAIESESIEALALGGGIASGLALFELLAAAFVIASGAEGWAGLLLLALWLPLTAWLAWRYWRSRMLWTDSRLAMTHDLIENMTGHRTRAAQQPSSQWHSAEDRAMEEYAALSRAMDRDSARLTALGPRGWLLAALAGLAPAFISPGAASQAKLAVAIGGILVAWQAFRRLSWGLAQLAGAAISWRQVSTMFHAAARPDPPAESEAAPGEPVVKAHDIAFRYSGRQAPVLTGLSMQVEPGDWVLLEGESGGGKSTLTALLAGLRQPSAGAIVRSGRVAMAPQYHENHVLTGTFAYNLLFGRNWPPYEADLAEAETVARELGLGPLIERMPAGMLQMVGETGWQLSQGERSRMFLARALLQNPDLVILDESFAALDPENLKRSLECALKRAKTLLVVAHP